MMHVACASDCFSGRRGFVNIRNRKGKCGRAGGVNKLCIPGSNTYFFEYGVDYTGLHERYVAELLDTLQVFSFIPDVLPFHISGFRYAFCVHIISISPFTMNSCFSDDTLLFSLFHSNTLYDTVSSCSWLNGNFFGLATLEFMLLTSLKEMTRTTEAPTRAPAGPCGRKSAITNPSRERGIFDRGGPRGPKFMIHLNAEAPRGPPRRMIVISEH